MREKSFILELTPFQNWGRNNFDRAVSFENESISLDCRQFERKKIIIHSQEHQAS